MPHVATETAIFDFYGTLVRPATPTRTLTGLLEALGVAITPEVAERWHIDTLDGVEHEDASVDAEAYTAWEESRWSGMLRDCGVTDERVAPLIDAVRFQVRSFQVAAFPETGDVLREIRDRGIRIGICSNWHWDLDPYLEQAEITDLVDVALTSARLGARKDHPLIYRRTLEAMDADPATVTFVGDSWRPDVIGPLEAGVRLAVHVVRSPDAPQPELPDGAARVRDLTGVLPLL